MPPSHLVQCYNLVIAWDCCCYSMEYLHNCNSIITSNELSIILSIKQEMFEGGEFQGFMVN